MTYQKDGNTYSFIDLQKDHPNIGFPRNALDNPAIRADYGIVEVPDPVVEEPTQPHPLPQREGYKIVGNEYVELTWREKRIVAYGPVAEQIEYITEHGLTLWQQKVSEIKAKYPTP